MSSNISGTLYVWLKDKRLMDAVARRMGKPPSTLAAELKSEKFRSKLGADDLVPLFRAIRETDYATEFEGVLKKFIKELGGERAETATVEQFGSLLFSVMQGIALLSKSADHIQNLTTAQELERLKTEIRAEIVPAVYKLEAIVDDRLTCMRKRVSRSQELVTEPQPIPTGV
jgi:hypothetical protein